MKSFYKRLTAFSLIVIMLFSTIMPAYAVQIQDDQDGVYLSFQAGDTNGISAPNMNGYYLVLLSGTQYRVVPLNSTNPGEALAAVTSQANLDESNFAIIKYDGAESDLTENNYSYLIEHLDELKTDTIGNYAVTLPNGKNDRAYTITATLEETDYYVRIRFNTTDVSRINTAGGVYVFVKATHPDANNVVTYGLEPVPVGQGSITVDSANNCSYVDVKISQ